MTDKKNDLHAREIEKKLHNDLRKLENASPQEIAVGEMEIASNLLKNCETASEFIEKIPDDVRNLKTACKPNCTPEAEKIHEKIKTDFKSSLNQQEKHFPTQVQSIRKRYWSVGIQL